MPQVFRVSNYLIYFWTNEGEPIEPFHVHVTSGTPSENDTKIWITSTGRCLMAHNKSNIPTHKLNQIMKIVEARHSEVLSKWLDYFGEVTYFC